MLKKKMRKSINLNPSKENIYIIESFIEDVCDCYNINDNYFANIIMAVTEASKLAHRHMKNNNIKIDFENSREGLKFEISAKVDWGKLILNKRNALELGSEEEREIFMIWSMPDRVKIENNGKSIIMLFKTEQLDIELANSRNETMNYYLNSQKKKNSNINI